MCDTMRGREGDGWDGVGEKEEERATKLRDQIGNAMGITVGMKQQHSWCSPAISR